jgi:methylaspartate ammonia-lyase
MRNQIEQVLFVPGYSAYYFDDQKAIKSGASQQGFVYEGEVQTPGFQSIRQSGRVLSVIILLSNGREALGDCAAVQYSGAGGRDPLFIPEDLDPGLLEALRNFILAADLSSFRDLSASLDQFQYQDRPIHRALKYGISQALLNAVSILHNELVVETVQREWKIPYEPKALSLFGQTGDDRFLGAEKMILKEVDVMPHGLFNSIEEKVGRRGEKLEEYLGWLSSRVMALRSRMEYRPVFHVDVYGTLGMIFDNSVDKIADYVKTLAKAAHPFKLYVEGPMDVGNREGQIDILSRLVARLDDASVKIVADEWCNTFEDVRDFTLAKACHMAQVKTPDLGCVHNIVDANLFLKDHGLEAYQGGTCNESDISAKLCTHLALASQPERVLVKPGMGFDEGYTIVKNEMERTLALLEYRRSRV